MALITCTSVMWKVVILSVAMMAITTVGATLEGNELEASSSRHGRFLLQESVIGRRHLLNARCGDSNGACKPMPWSDMQCCGGFCKDVDKDDHHCGDCNNECKFGWKCCGGKCVNVMSDPDNCLICGKKCPSGEPCQGGMCGYNSW